MSGASAWPTRLRFQASARRLRLELESGDVLDIPYELLRVESPSAEVQGHAGRKSLVAGKRFVGVGAAEPVGSYAVRIVFDDGHDSGLFTWDYLERLGRDAPARLAAYEAEIAAAGLSRDPG